MRIAVLLALLGTLSNLFGIVFMTMGRHVEHPSISINGWALLFGLVPISTASGPQELLFQPVTTSDAVPVPCRSRTHRNTMRDGEADGEPPRSELRPSRVRAIAG